MSKTALVTGASSGIGLEFAKVLAENNYDLILVSRTQLRLDEIANNFRVAYGIKVYVIVCDLFQSEACRNIYKQVKEADLEIDILVNNAGIGDWGPFIGSDWAKQEKMLQLNIVALTELTWIFLPEMKKRRTGRILNIASTAAFQPGPLMAVYYATKAYVLSFSLAIAQELKGRGVTVTCLCPGPTATSFQALTFPKEIRLTKGRKLPTAQEVALYGYRSMFKGKTLAVHGIFNKLVVFSMRFLPQWVALRIVHFAQESK